MSEWNEVDLMPRYRLSPQRRWFCSLGIGMLLAVSFSYGYTYWHDFSQTCIAIRADTLRLHVQANSDSVADQTVKLKVRDACLEQMETLYAEIDNLEEAVAAAERALPAFALVARETLATSGVADDVTVYVTKMYFDTTVYESFTLPAGEYMALRVEIGAHEGHNWWCVLYPQMCLSAAGTGYASDAENQLIAGKYEIRFATVEWLEQWKSKRYK